MLQVPGIVDIGIVRSWPIPDVRISKEYRVFENVTSESHTGSHERLRQRPILTISAFAPPTSYCCTAFFSGHDRHASIATDASAYRRCDVGLRASTQPTFEAGATTTPMPLGDCPLDRHR